MKLILWIAGTVIAGVFACVTTPETNRRALRFIPDSTMNSLSDQSWVEMKKNYRLSENKELISAVNAIGTKVAKASGASFQWEFAVFDEPKSINAFCLPNGKIGVYTGIIPVAATHGGLAAILGHEVAHAVLKHGAERMSQNVVAQFGLAALGQMQRDSKYQPYILAALGLGMQVGVLMPYSRYHESEADKLGLKYMAKAGYDPKEAVLLWQRMAQKDSGTPEFMSTHPNSKGRSRDLESEISVVHELYVNNQNMDSAKKLPSL